MYFKKSIERKMAATLKKHISFYTLTMIAIGSSIGSGIFKTPSEISGYLPVEGWMLAVWIVGGIIALCGALTFAEISANYPKAGGFYVFLREAYGELPAFLYGWTMLGNTPATLLCCMSKSGPAFKRSRTML